MYPLTAGIVIETKELWDELQTSLQELPVRILFEQSEIGDLGILTDKIERMRPEVMFVDITSLRAPLEGVIRGLRSASAGPAIFALNTGADPEVILNSLRAGAAEYLYPPFGRHLRSALERVGNERKAAKQSIRKGGHTVAFVSAKGGCGATTIACHTAVELPQETKGRVLLADLDFDAGMIGFLAKSKSPYNISDAAGNTQRLDENYWKALISNGLAPGLEIVTAPAPTARLVLKPERLKFVISFVRTQYDWIVLDLGRSLNATSLATVEDIDDLFVVTTLDVPALHQAKVVVQKLLDSGYSRSKLQLILNRAPRRYEVTLEELENMIGAPVHTTIPDDYSALNESYSEGKLLSSGSSLGKHFVKLASKIAGTEKTAKRKFSIFG